MSANRRKLVEPTITIASTSSSGTTAQSDNASNHEKVSYYVNVTAATGTLALVIQSTADGTNWASMATAEMSGQTANITTTGTYRLSSNSPIGIRTRLSYTIGTGPFAFTVIPVYEKSGSVY